jgi:hypothetical protein
MRSALVITIAVFLGCVARVEGQPGKPLTAPDLSGVYQVISPDVTLPGGLRNSGAPEDIALRPEAVEQMKGIDVAQDPEKMCQPIGPFRMMARASTKIELVSPPSSGMIVMLFENISHGFYRTIFLDRAHPEDMIPAWHGYSVGRWEGSTLVIESVGFNERTWLNSRGAPHSDALRLVERIRPVLAGKYLEYRVTADDAKALVQPYTYTRYYEKLATEIGEDVCEE